MLNDSSNTKTKTNMVLLKYGGQVLLGGGGKSADHRKSLERSPMVMTSRSNGGQQQQQENMSPTVKYVRKGDNFVQVASAFSPPSANGQEATLAPDAAFSNPEYMSLAELQKNIAILNGRQYGGAEPSKAASHFGPPPSKKPPSPPHTPPVIVPNDRRRRLAAALPVIKTKTTPKVPIYQNVADISGGGGHELPNTPLGSRAVYLINKSLEEAKNGSGKRHEQHFAAVHDPIHVDVNFANFRTSSHLKPIISPNTIMRSNKQNNLLLKPTTVDKDLNSSMSSSSLLAGSFMSSSQQQNDLVNSTSLSGSVSTANNTSTSSTGTMIVRKSPSPGSQTYYSATRQLLLQQQMKELEQQAYNNYQLQQHQDDLDHESSITKSRFLFQQTPQSQIKRFKQPHYQTQFAKDRQLFSGPGQEEDFVFAQTEPSPPPRFLFDKQPSTPAKFSTSGGGQRPQGSHSRHSIVTTTPTLAVDGDRHTPSRRSVPATFLGNHGNQQHPQEPASRAGSRENKLIGSLSPIMTSSRADLHVISDVAGLEPSPPFIPSSPGNDTAVVNPEEGLIGTPKLDQFQSRSTGSIKYRQLNFGNDEAAVLKRRLSASHGRSQSIVRSPEMPIEALKAHMSSSSRTPTSLNNQVYNESYFSKERTANNNSFGGVKSQHQHQEVAESKFATLPRASNAANSLYNAEWSAAVDTSNSYDNPIYGLLPPWNNDQSKQQQRPVTTPTPASNASNAAPIITYSPSQNSPTSNSNSSLSDSASSSPSSLSSMLLLPPSPFKTAGAGQEASSVQLTTGQFQQMNNGPKSLQPILVTNSNSMSRANKKKTSSKKVSFLLSADETSANEDERSFAAIRPPPARLERISEDIYSTEQFSRTANVNGDLEYMRRHAKSSTTVTVSTSSPSPSASSSSSSPQNSYPAGAGAGIDQLYSQPINSQQQETTNLAAFSNTVFAKIFNNNDYFVPSVGVATTNQAGNRGSLTTSTSSSTSSSSSGYKSSFQSPHSTFPRPRGNSNMSKSPNMIGKYGSQVLVNGVVGRELDTFVESSRDRLDRMKTRRSSSGAPDNTNNASKPYPNNNNTAGSRTSVSSTSSSPPGSLLTSSSSGSSSSSSQSPIGDNQFASYQDQDQDQQQQQQRPIDSIIIKNVSAKIFQKILQQQQHQKPLGHHPNGQVFGGSPMTTRRQASQDVRH